MAKLTDDYIRKMAQDYTYNPKYNDPGTGEALEELLELRERTRWIPVTEKLPDKDGIVMVYMPDSGIDMVFCRKSQFKTFSGVRVTHWMSLPEIPEVKEWKK